MFHQQQKTPTIFIIFGATGDLMAKKIAPALFHLFQKQKLPRLFRIIGFAKRPLSDTAFHNHISKILKSHHKRINKKDLKKFLSIISYNQGRFESTKDYHILAKTLGCIDGDWKVCSNKLFYLAVPPRYFEKIFINLKKSGLTIPCNSEEGWTRVIVEKPFGKNLKTAENLDLLLAKLFKEEQIYRIDHYLAKEMLQNILSFRFSNNLFEKSWNNKFIEKIDIKLLEKIGVKHRGQFYDGLGSFRDVGQNHLLQMLALVTMDNPKFFNSQLIRLKRSQILKTLKKPTLSEIKKYTVRGQYQDYKKIKGVYPKSNSETYFKTIAFLDNPRWQGVPITLESGKMMRNQIKEIVITFKHTLPCLCPHGIKNHYKNKIVFQIEPQEAIKIHFLAKKPGLEMEVEKRSFDFIYRKKTKTSQYVEEYEKLLLDCIDGNQVLFLSTDEVKSMWQYTDPIIKGWQKNLVPLQIYKPETNDIVKKNRFIFEKKTKQSNKEIAIIGLGKMGSNMAKNLIEKGWKVIGYNRTPSVTKQIEKSGLIGAYTIKELVNKLSRPRKICILLPAYLKNSSIKPIEKVIFGKKGLLSYLDKKDIIIEAGNSYYKDSIRREKLVKKKGVSFVDMGISGGPAGARHGACLMVGGNKKVFNYLLPFFIDLAIPQGVQFFNGPGAGHFVKMIHNGIEYGMMQAIAEGFNVLKKSKYKLDLTKATHIYNHGSVIESRLISWLKDGFELYGQDLKNISGHVSHTGEGAWTVKTAKELGLKTKIIDQALKFRIQSEKNPQYTGKVLTTLRNQFGGHSINK